MAETYLRSTRDQPRSLQAKNTSLFVDRIENVIRTTCNATFKQYSSQKKAYKGEISPLVVDRTYYNEEKNYCTKEEITKNTEQ